MKGNKLKILACFCAAGIACAGFTACGEKKDPLDAKHGIADQSKLYGMCYLLEERDAVSLDIRSEVALMKNLGVKTVRQWMHFTHFMSAPDTLKPNCDTTAKMHELLAACEEAGMTNIGMNHHNFCTTQIKPYTTAKPFARDVSEGSEYIQWLNDYYTSWKTLVAEFPEVLYWEVDNEVNNPDFMTEGGTKGQSSYNLRQMAAIATDMFYYATRAIHEVNPAAQSVMGGLTEPTGLGNGNTATYLQIMYDYIASGEYGYFYGKEDKANASTNADDYFEIACWHPYMSNFNKQNFIDINNEYYEIILKNEGKHKKVFFTEVGWNDNTIGGEDVSVSYMEQMYDALTQMPYVETANIFKLYDTGKLNNWDGAGFLYYGLVHDPDPTHVYTRAAASKNAINVTEDGVCITGAPKNKAYAFQKMAGGEGSLELLVKK